VSGALDELRRQCALAAPIAAVSLGMMAMGVVDVVMVGRVSEADLAAVALGHLVVFGVLSFGLGLLMVLDPVIAQAVGARDERALRRGLQRGLLLATLLAVPAAAVMTLAGPLLDALDQPPRVAAIASRYALWSIPGAPAFLLFVALRSTLQAMQRLRPIVVTILVANAANAALNWVLVFGNLGSPPLGAAGCGLATSIARWIMVATLLLASRRVLGPYLRPLDPIALHAEPLLRMARLGAPIGLQVMLEIMAFNTIGVFMGWFGEEQIGGHQITLSLSSIAFMLPLGIGQAAAVRCGQAVGRQDPGGVRRAAWVALVIGPAVMLGSATLFLTLPETLVRLYTDLPGPAAVALTLLPLAALFQVADGTQVVAMGVLRGLADTRFPMLVNFVGYWLFGLPLGLATAFVLGAGPAGLWWGLVFSLTAVALVLLVRVRRCLSRTVARVRLDEEEEGEEEGEDAAARPAASSCEGVA